MVEVFAGFGALLKRTARGSEVSGKIAARRERILKELDALSAEVHAVNAGLKPLFEKAYSRIDHELERIAEKTAAALQQQDGPRENHLRQLATLVRPKDMPQERVLCTAAFMLEFPALARELFESIDPDVREHQVVLLE
jgi:hypothetical protein